jgi:Flp pilus assembly protein CpaB
MERIEGRDPLRFDNEGNTPVRASTLFAIAVALLVGLGATVAVKLSGFLSSPPPLQSSEPAPKVEVPPPAPMVVVASHNHFASYTLSPNDVFVRALRPEEMANYEKNKTKYLPGLIQAAVLRVPKVNLVADQPIMQDQLEEFERPQDLHDRLLPTMRAVSLPMDKELSAAGMIAVNDWVDVYLTSEVTRPGEPKTVKTALLAKHALVIAKRDSLWATYAPLPSGPITHMLALNPYRAALIEFARGRGTLSIVPVSKTEKDMLEKLQAEAKNDPKRVIELSYPNTDSPEFSEESKKVAMYTQGKMTVGQEDLAKIFELKPIPAPVTIETFNGVGGKPNSVNFGGSKPGTPQGTEFTPPVRTPTPASPASGSGGAGR